MPSAAFRAAWSRARMSDFRFSLMARPAASSPARLIRRPELSFSIDLLNMLVEFAGDDAC